MAASVARGLAGDDGGDPLPAGGRLGRAGCAAAVPVGPARFQVDAQMSGSLPIVRLSASWLHKTERRVE